MWGSRGHAGRRQPAPPFDGAAARGQAPVVDKRNCCPIKLFPDRDSIELVCRSSAAGGWAELRVLFDVAGNALTKLYALEPGSYQAITPDERKRGECPRAPLGSLRVEKVGPRPQLRVIDPDAATPGNLYNGIGTLPARQLAYDPERREFVATGAPDLPTKVDNHDCRHR
jgi:hypothetical protein